MAAIVAGMTGVGDCSEVSETRLRAWTGSHRFGSGVTPGLHLQGRGLSALQAGDLRDLHALRALDLNRNFLETVPDGLFEDLRTVEEIYLSGNLLGELPEGTLDGQAANLSVLDLSANGLETLPEDVLRNLDALVSLSLAGNGLVHLPAGLFDDLVELEELDLSANLIDELPDGVFDGGLEMRDLDLSANSIDDLPEGVFGGLGNLQRLSLAGNDLKSLPKDVFADLGSLGELDLSGNEFKDLPVDVFEGLSGLTYLDAGDNPGAPFTFTAELERRGDDTVMVRLAEGATPFDLKIVLSARNGDLSAETVTIASGSSYSDVIDVRPHGHHPVTVEIDSADFLLPSGVQRRESAPTAAVTCICGSADHWFKGNGSRAKILLCIRRTRARRAYGRTARRFGWARILRPRCSPTSFGTIPAPRPASTAPATLAWMFQPWARRTSTSPVTAPACTCRRVP